MIVDSDEWVEVVSSQCDSSLANWFGLTKVARRNKFPADEDGKGVCKRECYGWEKVTRSGWW